MSMVAVFKSLLLAYSTVDLFYALKAAIAAFSTQIRDEWLQCFYHGHPSCFDPNIQCREIDSQYQYYSKCYSFFERQGRYYANFTWEQMVIGLTTSSGALRELPTQIYL
ncbi:unnamed protein product [Thelazia callipaeda]|uniref:Anoctamin n=1 Tax=Thelazia callipaeda TaxID=103827 RepID=A0A0N5DBH3_THECL|nr:unnamed protein product [Thelazia callipaeda]